MNYYLSLFGKGFKLTLASAMAYKGDFFAKLLGYVLWNAVTPVLGLLVYAKSSGFPGWTFWEFILLQGCLLFIWGFYDSFVQGVTSTISDEIEMGSFDRVLAKPTNPFITVLCESQTTEGYPSILLSPVLIIIALYKLGAVSFVNLLAGTYVIFLAMVFMIAITTMVAASSFLTVRTSGVRAITGLLWDYTKYPTNIFGKKAFWIFSFIIPLATVSFYPASAILGKIDYFILIYLTIAVLVFLAASILFWNYGIKKYTSAGG